MYESLFEDEAEQALEFRAANPRAPEPPKPTVWSQTVEILKAVPKGVGQAAMQTARNVQSGPVAGNPLAMTASEQADMLQDSGVTFQAVDRDLRRGVDALKPDPVTSTLASQVLQDGARVLSKVGLYAATGGPVGAMVGTGLDEGLTGRRELMDQGVDAKTATKAGAVRGVAMAAGVMLPVVGATAMRTAGLVAVGGPGLFVSEQAATRAILEAAEYPHLARQYDPTDPVGLGVSLLVPGVIGAAVHRSRAKARAATSETPDTLAPDADAAPATENAPAPVQPLTELLRSMPELQDAALVANKSHALDAHLLADPADVAARQSHVAAFEAAARAMDEGAPVRIDALELDPARAQAVMADIRARIDAAEAELAPLREQEAAPLVDMAPLPEPDQPRRPPVPDGGFDIGNLLAEASTLLAGGRGAGNVVDQMRAAGRPVSPEMQNALVGLQEFPDRAQEVLNQFRDVEWSNTGKGNPADMLAEAIERMRLGDGPPTQNTPLGRAVTIAREQPDLPIRMDEGDVSRSAAEVVDEVRQDARRDRKDAKAFAAAVECMLRTGS